MRNHSFLYLLRPDGEEGELQRIAESNSVFPSLWRILLAGGCIASFEAQRVLQGTAVHVAEVDAERALARYERFVALMMRHPRRDQIAGLTQYLEGAALHLRELISDWTLPDASRPVFCADFDELVRSDDLPVGAFMRQQLDRSRQMWERIDALALDFDVLVMEQLFGFREANLRFTDWRAWSGLFGLALFEHRYFARAFRRPLECAYGDYEYDELGTDPLLGHGLRRFKEGAYWGVQVADGATEKVVLKAEWERVLRAGVAEPDVVWIKRADRYGLAAIRGARAGKVLMEPILDEVAHFENGLATVRIGSKMGFLRNDGRWHLAPAWDRVWPFRCERALVDMDQRLGYIDMQGASIVGPRFDEAGHFTLAGVALVRQRKHFGLLDRSGDFALELQYSRIEWSQPFEGWKCFRDDAWMLVHADGNAWIEPCEEIDVCIPQHSIRVRRAGHYGLLDWSGRVLIENEYERLDLLDGSSGASSQIALIARRSRRMGVIDERGKQLVPFEFSRIEPLSSHERSDGDAEIPRLLRVYSIPRRGRPEVGIWELGSGLGARGMGQKGTFST